MKKVPTATTSPPSLCGALGSGARPSGLDFLDRVRDVDSSVSRALGDVSGQERGNVMRHESSVLHGLLKLVRWTDFELLVDKHGQMLGCAG
jgi:hypothetical protein